MFIVTGVGMKEVFLKRILDRFIDEPSGAV